jgi:protein-S-isoprenylcysteine O-methyltransferase Ste14
MRLFLTLSGWIAFTAYTMTVMAGQGVLGFVVLAQREPWAMQMLLDLLVMLGLFAAWIRHDARWHRLPAWAYMLLTVAAGSMGALAYLVHRELVRRRR